MIKCKKCEVEDGMHITRKRKSREIWALDTDLAEEYPDIWTPVHIAKIEKDFCGYCKNHYKYCEAVPMTVNGMPLQCENIIKMGFEFCLFHKKYASRRHLTPKTYTNNSDKCSSIKELEKMLGVYDV